MKKYRLVKFKPAWWFVSTVKVLVLTASFIAIAGLPLIAGIIMGG